MLQKYALMVLGMALVQASLAYAGSPDPASSECVVTVLQSPVTVPCQDPPVARLCPEGDFDTILFQFAINDSTGAPCQGVPVVLCVAEETNIEDNTSTVALTDALGSAELSVSSAGGNGAIKAFVGPFQLCEIRVKSPDVAVTTKQCGPLDGPVASFVNSVDVTHPICGFLSKWGPVTPGVNSDWDLNCSGGVNAIDIFGWGLSRQGGVFSHFGHGSILSLQEGCP